MWKRTSETEEVENARRSLDLVTRIQSGDRIAEDELIEQYRRGVAWVIRRQVGEPSATDDLFQKTFLIVLEKIRGGEVREPEKLLGFILAVARNLVIEYFRRERRQASFIELDDIISVSDPKADQHDQLVQKEKAEIVRRVLEEMSNQRDRELLLRFYLLGEEKEQICVDLQLTSLHFNRVLHRALKRYKKLYQQRTRHKGGS